MKKLHNELREFAKTLQLDEDQKLLYKTGFLLLVDLKLKKTIMSYEVINSNYPFQKYEWTDEEKLKGGKIRPPWINDPDQCDVSILEATPGDEKGHIATYSNHKAKLKIRKESCYYTNCFSQIPGFHAYRKVEEWPKQKFWRFTEAAVITFLQYGESNRPSSIWKIVKWKRSTEQYVTIFRFPNPKVKPDKNDYSFKYMTSTKVLSQLPFTFGLKDFETDNVSVDMIKGGNWKSAVEQVIIRKANKHMKLVIEPKECKPEQYESKDESKPSTPLRITTAKPDSINVNPKRDRPFCKIIFLPLILVLFMFVAFA